MDESTLPVEDTTQGFPAEETPEPEAPAAEAPDAETGVTDVPLPPEDEKQKGIEKRISELTRARHDAEREAAFWRGKAEGQKPEAGHGPQSEAEAKPKQEAFASYEEYLEALTDWKLSERLQTERMRLRQEHQAQTVAQGFDGQVKTAREKHADFDAVVYNEDLQISETMRDCMIHSEGGAGLAYHLGKHPEEAARIANLPPMVQVMAIGRLQQRLEAPARAPAAPIPSNAPAPISPVKASAPATAGLREDLAIGDWMKRRNAELYKR